MMATKFNFMLDTATMCFWHSKISYDPIKIELLQKKYHQRIIMGTWHTPVVYGVLFDPVSLRVAEWLRLYHKLT